MEIKTIFREATIRFDSEKELSEYLSDLSKSHCSYWLLKKEPAADGSVEVLIRTQALKGHPIKRQKFPYEVERREYENAPIVDTVRETSTKAKMLCYRLDRHGQRVKSAELVDLIEDLHFLEKKVQYPFLERKEGVVSHWSKRRQKELIKWARGKEKR